MRLHVLGAAVACAVLAGCGSGSSTNTLPPTPPSDPSIVVTAPADGAVVKGAPVQIGINTKNLSDPGKLAIYLNGTNVTSQFSQPGIAGNSIAQIKQPTVQYGKNQIQINYDALTINSTFSLDTSTGTDPTAPGSPVNSGPGPLLPIQTRVLAPNADPSKATSWGIQVGMPGAPNSQFYASPTPIGGDWNPCTHTCWGFQILLLRRTDLSVVSNNSYEIYNAYDLFPDHPFAQALESMGAGKNDPSTIGDGLNISTVQKSPPAECVPQGCIMVMQSLSQIGDTICDDQGTNAINCSLSPWIDKADDPSQYRANLIYWLTKIGATGNVLFANGSNPHVGYSFIGNVGSGRMPGQGTTGIVGTNTIQYLGNNGSQFDRLGCSDAGAGVCDNLNWAGSENSDPVGTPGQLTGVLIHDNYGFYTFSENAPPITYNFGTTMQSGNPVMSLTLNGWLNYSMTMPSGSGGGFWLLILNRTAPDWQDGKLFSKYYNLDPGSLDKLANDINSHSDANDLVFLASLGNITHDAEDSTIAPAWETLVQAVQKIGADPLTFRILGEHHQGFPAFNADGKDDYLLVGKPIANQAPAFENFTAGMPLHFTAAEAGYVIARQTQAYPMWPTHVSGVLKRDRQGYYTPTLQSAMSNNSGFIQPLEAGMANASLLNPVPWPAMSPGEVSAYQNISGQLNASEDVRSTYPTRTPGTYDLSQVTYPTGTSKFTEDDFANVKAQLTTEFRYWQEAYDIWGDLQSLRTNSAVNVSSILQEAANAVNADIQNSGAKVPPRDATWSIIANDVLPEFGGLTGVIPVVGGFTQSTIGLATTNVDDFVLRTNDASGASQVQQSLANEDILAADLNQYQTSQFDDTIATLANDYVREVTDWGRLSAIAKPYDDNDSGWDVTAIATYMRVLDLSARRRYYQLLMAGNGSFFVTHVQQADDEYVGRFFSYCDAKYFYQAQDANYTGQSPDGQVDFTKMTGTAWYPGSIDPKNTNYWDIWAIGEKPNTLPLCPFGNDKLPNMYGMFLPVQSIDAGSIGNLGLWRPYVFEYGGFNNVTLTAPH